MVTASRTSRIVPLLLCAVAFAGGCGSSGKNPVLVGLDMGIGAGIIGTAAKPPGAVVAKSKYEREANERDRDLARQRAQEVARRDASTNHRRMEDFYVMTQPRGQQVEAVKVSAATNEPVGPVIGIDQKDIDQARNRGKPVQIDGLELAGVDSLPPPDPDDIVYKLRPNVPLNLGEPVPVPDDRADASFAGNQPKPRKPGAPALVPPIGCSCRIQFRKDAVEQSGPSRPIEEPESNATVARLMGVLVAADASWLVLRLEKGRAWIPREVVLFIEVLD